jgi:hypothetical protein
MAAEPIPFVPDHPLSVIMQSCARTIEASMSCQGMAGMVWSSR